MKGEWIETRAGVSRNENHRSGRSANQNQHGPNRAADL